MKNTFGNSLCITLFGESHGEMIGAVIDGLTPGIAIDRDYIADRLSHRRPHGNISTARQEADDFRIVSGVYNGRSTGTPICILIPNSDTNSKDYSALQNIARPGHADYTAECKYHGFQDPRGGGHFSGRLTAPLVAAGAIIESALYKKGISVGTHIKECADIFDRDFDDHKKDIEYLKKADFPVLSAESGNKMKELIEKARADRDSVGGILQTIISGVPAGVGEPWFDSFEGILSHALFSIPAIKGVEFGDGFAMARMYGSEANDAFFAENGRIATETNHNGGINGGISNGMPILFSCAVKPTPSISKPQRTVDFKKCENTETEICGRHDPAIIHRAVPVVDSIAAIVTADMLLQRFGTDFLA